MKKRFAGLRSASKVIDSTTEFYESHAREYFDRTASADLSALYDSFLSHVRPGGRILDVGCGSGRDLKVFRQRGFKPVGIDASPTLVKLAHTFSGVVCKATRFQDLNFREYFDAVWACASLLHLPKRRIGRILRRLYTSLIDGGTLFVSMQIGCGEKLAEDGRFFAYYQPDELARRVQKAGFSIDRVWISEDSLPGRTRTRWVNVIAHRERVILEAGDSSNSMVQAVHQGFPSTSKIARAASAFRR